MSVLKTSLLQEYRDLDAEICAAAIRTFDAPTAAERDQAHCEFEGLLERQAALITIMTSLLGVYTRARLPTFGPLHERLMALPLAARRAYQSQQRLEVAEADFHVHLLTWADSCYTSMDQIIMDQIKEDCESLVERESLAEKRMAKRRDTPATKTNG